MHSFPFNIKIWASFEEKAKHKWLKKWLKTIYIALHNNEISPQGLLLVKKQWQTLQEKAAFPILYFPNAEHKQEWLILLSDQYHWHQQKTNIGKQESDFLPTIEKGDKEQAVLVSPKFNYTVALDNVRSAFNVGSVYRTAEACRFMTVIHGGITPHEINRQVQKTARLTIDKLISEHTNDLQDNLLQKQKEGYTIIGIETAKEALYYQDYIFPSKAVFVLGNEEYGIRPPILSICDSLVKLPMLGWKRSLNVSHSFSVIAYSAVSQFITTNTLPS